MSRYEYYYSKEWNFSCSSSELWNKVVTFSKKSFYFPNIENVTNHNLTLKKKFMFITIDECHEEPYEWVFGHKIGVVRKFSHGLFTDMKISLKINDEIGASKLLYDLWVIPKNRFGALFFNIFVRFILKFSVENKIRKLERELNPNPLSINLFRIKFSPGGKKRLNIYQEKLLSQNLDVQCVRNLVAMIRNSDDISLAQIRPYTLADFWGLSRNSVLEVFIHAVRIGLLNFKWNLLYPVADHKVENYSDDNDYLHTNFDKMVEIVFSINPSIRKINIETTTKGLQSQPTIITKQLLLPHEKRSVKLNLCEGRYRVKLQDMKGYEFLKITKNGYKNPTLRVRTQLSNSEIDVSTDATLSLKNDTTTEQFFILERMSWNEQAATAFEVTNLNFYKDLFANNPAVPSEKMSVESLTILFTDLRGSTKLYREYGDAVAFGHVMDHFDILKKCIEEESGSIVKTIGDAVMAVFPRPLFAVKSILRAQEMFEDKQAHNVFPLKLKAGIHHGTCISIYLNDKLDYFGNNVNFASRLESVSSGNDVILSKEVYQDPEVRSFVNKNSEFLYTENFQSFLKGFDQEESDLWRIQTKGVENNEEIQSQTALFQMG